MSISSHSFSDIGARIKRTLLAQDCILCQAASGERPVCAACERELPSSAFTCPRCALAGSSNAQCGACLADEPYFDASFAAFAYAYPADALILAFKYGGQLALAGFFAHKLQQRLGPAAGADLIVPLPLHPVRLSERGFNQAAEIAKALSRLTGIRMDAHLARRERDTAPQAALPWKERAANMRHAFRCERDLGGLRIAVIDDVMTTGATLNEFARTLKTSGAARVENWVVARTPPGV